MGSVSIETEEAVRSLVRLRRAKRTAEAETARELEPIVGTLERAVGPTVSRASAARLLGISFSALDRWIDKGDISAVLTPEGRREVPLSQLVDLLEHSEELRPKHGSRALATLIRKRRRQADAISDGDILPQLTPSGAPHRAADLRSLAYHRLVARRLDDDLVEEARRRLDRWRAADRLHEHWADAWEDVLERPVPEIARLIGSDTPEARALRQSSPFAGALTDQERRRSIRAVEKSLAG